MTNEDKNFEGIVGDSNIVERPTDTISGWDNSPRWFRYTTTGVLVATQITYIVGFSYGLDKELQDRNELVAYFLPVLFAFGVAGTFVIREGYSRAVNCLADRLYSDRNSTP